MIIQQPNLLYLSMNLNQILLSFSDLFKTKKIVFNHIQQIIQDFHQISCKTPFSQRLSIISTIAYFFNQALKNQDTLIDKLKYEIFYGVLKDQDASKRRSRHTTKKNHNRNGQKKKADITINQILEQAISDGLTQLDNSIVPQITIKQVQNISKNYVVLPSFQPQVIAQITQDMNMEFKTPQKQGEMLQWQPSKLQNYQKWLALTQKGIVVTHQARPPRTKKKHPQKQQILIDDKIDLSQGVSQLKLLQNLATKVKASRQLLQKQSRTFQHRIQNINPLLTSANNETNLAKLKSQFSKLKKKGIKQQIIQSQPKYNDLDINYCSIHQNKSQSSNSSFKEIHKSNILRQKLSNVIKQGLVITKKVTFRKICQSKTISHECKGQIFYQLLHLNLKLQQKEVNSFGDILISVGQ